MQLSKFIKRIPKTLDQSQAYTFGNNKYKGRIEDPFSYIVKGWVGSVTDSQPQWVKITKGNEVQVVLADIPRKDVVNSKQLDYENCGFYAKFKEDNDAIAIAEVMLSANELSLAKPSYKDRKLFFIHIPKTAGSSLNSLIQQYLHEYASYTHIEGMKDEWKEIVNAKFVSGHVRYFDYLTHFGSHDFVITSFFREPKVHLKSHLNWVLHLSEDKNKEFLAKHSLVVQQITAELYKFDFKHIKSWEYFVNNIKPREFGLFDNPQVRYLSDVKPGQRVNESHLKQALSKLSLIHLAGLADKFEESMQMISCAMNYSFNKDCLIRENTNKYNYCGDLFESDIEHVISPLIQYDQILYQAVIKKFNQQKILFL